MQRTAWGLGGADPALTAALDAADLDQLVQLNDARYADAVDVDAWTAFQSKLRGAPTNVLWAGAIGGLALGVLLLMPSPSGSRRR